MDLSPAAAITARSLRGTQTSAPSRAARSERLPGSASALDPAPGSRAALRALASTSRHLVALSLAAMILGLWAWPQAAASSQPPDPAGREAPSAARQPVAADEDPRPIVRLEVRSGFRPDDRLLPLLVEGRLVSNLADMETFRTVGGEGDGDFLLTCTIRDMTFGASSYATISRDADSSGAPTSRDIALATMNLDLFLQMANGKPVHRAKLAVQASREIEISLERTSDLLTQELIDRSAQKIERLLRKKLRKF